MIRSVEWDIIVAVPMIYRGQSLGVVNAYYLPVPEPSEAEVAFLTAIAHQAAVAVENARLFHDAEEKAALEERQRLARDLHDSVSQALYGIGLGARTARALLDRAPQDADEPLDYVLSLAEAGLSEMRSLIFELRPESLERESLPAAIDRQVTAIRARHTLEVTADYRGCEGVSLPLPIKETLFRVAQEALHNATRHAHASLASVDLVCAAHTVRLTIRDNGVGFDVNRQYPGHFGLRGMRERVLRQGGKLTIESTPGSGTTVTATVTIP
jgi:signal transduction histidine kinase